MLSKAFPTLVVLLLVASPAAAQELRFAGSAQLDYLGVVTDEKARDFTIDGFTTELSLKISIDVSEAITGQVKACYGCHGFELPSAYVDIAPVDFLNLRAGRFTPDFGDFPTRHDPANHLTNDKPLPYDMGRMLRLREWNMSVLPAPYVDNGLEIGTHFGLGESVLIDTIAYVIGGLRASDGATDVDYIQSRSGDFYYADNNSWPMVGGRLEATIDPAPSWGWTLGASVLWGTYDPSNELDLLTLGADLVVRVKSFVLRAEYLLRRTEMSLGDNPSENFIYGPGSDGDFDPHFLKDGFYVEGELPIIDALTLTARWDGLRRFGNVPVGGSLRSESALLRYTLGLAWEMVSAWRLKVSGEFYDFSDFDDEGAFHLGLVGAF